MIKDVLNLQGNDIQLLEEGYSLILETKKHRKLVVKMKESLKNEEEDDN